MIDNACKQESGQIVKLFLDPDNTGITLSNALVESNWTTKINSEDTDRMFIIPFPDDVVVDDQEPQFEDNSLEGQDFIHSGELKYQFIYKNEETFL